MLSSGTTVRFAGSSNNINDGFAMMIAGTFGPGHPISFTYSDTNPATSDTVAFTLVAVPEPASQALFLAGLIVIGCIGLRGKMKLGSF